MCRNGHQEHSSWVRARNRFFVRAKRLIPNFRRPERVACVSSTCVTSVSADCVDSSIILSSNVLLEFADSVAPSSTFSSSSVLVDSAPDVGKVTWIGVASSDVEVSTTSFLRVQTFRKGAHKVSAMLFSSSTTSESFWGPDFEDTDRRLSVERALFQSGTAGVVDLVASEDISDLRLDTRRLLVSVGSDCARGLVEVPSSLDSAPCILFLRENGSFVANSLRVEIPAAIENLRRALRPSFSTEFICSSWFATLCSWRASLFFCSFITRIPSSSNARRR